MSCGVGCRCGLDLVLLWLCCGPVATAPIGPLAWEPPYAAGAAQEMAKRQKQTNKQKTTTNKNQKKKKTKRTTCSKVMDSFLRLSRSRMGLLFLEDTDHSAGQLSYKHDY